MAKVGQPVEQPSGPAAQSPPVQTIWTSIHPRLLELVRAHRSTLLFVNSRRLAERLAAALNELAGEPLVRAHHGSLARAQRTEIEDLLKAGRLRALVATSSLELGIDMGAIDLVVQIEAPPSVASGLQRIGRSGHRVDETSRGVIFPKFRGDLLACAAVTGAMTKGLVEPSRYPRNPLDVLAQQIVAMTSMDHWSVDDLYRTIRGAAPFAELSRRVFEGVLDMLSGRYPSDEFAELRPRVTWDRVNGTVAARQGAKRVAITNAGTIPDRGLYGVFLADGSRDGARVGELDEEMVFEARAGETFLLGASTWRIEQITHDRVLVAPAPGEPGKMPFWKGEGPGRPIELGQAIGKLTRDLRQAPAGRSRGAADAAITASTRSRPRTCCSTSTISSGRPASCPTTARSSSSAPPTTSATGGYSVLTPFGSRVHAPWAMAVTAQLRDERGLDAEVMWSDDGFVVRMPEGDEPLDPRCSCPTPTTSSGWSCASWAPRRCSRRGSARPRAGRCCCPGAVPARARRLWQQRKRAADLLAVAARFGSFPMILEAYRECLRDVFDLPALVELLTKVRSRTVRVHTVDVQKSSPFAASLLFGYVANYLYDGDAPLAERRAHALSVDQAQLAELIGEGELRTLVDPDALAALERDAQQLPAKYHARSTDAVHDLLLRLGDLSVPEIEARSVPGVAARGDRRAGGAPARAAGEGGGRGAAHRGRGRRALPRRPRHAAAGRACRPRCWSRRPMRSSIWCGATPARTVRSRLDEVAARLGLGAAVVTATLQQLAQAGRVVEGRVPARWTGPRVVRRRRAACGAQPIAGGAAQGSGAGRAARPRPLPGVVARAGSPARRAGRAARRGRAAAGRAAGRVGARTRGAGGAGRRTIRRRCSTRWCRRAKSPGWASSRWASAMAASRCTSPTICGCWRRRPRPTACSIEKRGSSRG